MSIPHVKRDEKGIPTLSVHDRPFFMRSGEIHNSNASSLQYAQEQLWPSLRGLGLNAVIVPLSWELIEPEEGSYDFSTVDGLVRQARDEDVEAILTEYTASMEPSLALGYLRVAALLAAQAPET